MYSTWVSMLEEETACCAPHAWQECRAMQLTAVEPMEVRSQPVPVVMVQMVMVVETKEAKTVRAVALSKTLSCCWRKELALVQLEALPTATTGIRMQPRQVADDASLLAAMEVAVHVAMRMQPHAPRPRRAQQQWSAEC